MLSEFDKLVKQRKELKEWWALKSTVAAHDHRFHTLRVIVQQPSGLSFCGQQYAGAQNYHAAPAFFRAAVAREIQDAAAGLVARAYNTEITRLDAEIEKHRAAVLAELKAD